jgi:hypothetical protein
MKFCFLITSGSEVIVLGREHQREVYYGEPVENGRWRIDLNKLETLIGKAFQDKHFGGFVDTFYCGLELADLEGWGDRFKKTRGYISLRPKMRAIVSVAQVDWLRVKDQPVEYQYLYLLEQTVDSVERIASAKRKPSGFEPIAMAVYLRAVMSSIQLHSIEMQP